LIHGVLNFNKSSGLTSHDVVNQIRHFLGLKQVGHLGTLDPLATGVLPILIGYATRLADLAHSQKEYLATCLLGIRTDSEDISGRVISEEPVPPIPPQKIQQIVQSFKQIQQQIPPMASAVKVQGQRLYKKFRLGQEVERMPRPIRIYESEVVTIVESRVSFRVVCSKGTYIRSLCKLLGEQLGIGACLEKLVRIAAGPFHIDQSVSFNQLQTLTREEIQNRFLLDPLVLIPHVPQIGLTDGELQQFRHGQKIKKDVDLTEWVSIVNLNHQLIGLAQIRTDGGSQTWIIPKKVFVCGTQDANES
jgi:tRNA pseudouridine55 synthase